MIPLQLLAHRELFGSTTSDSRDSTVVSGSVSWEAAVRASFAIGRRRRSSFYDVDNLRRVGSEFFNRYPEYILGKHYDGGNRPTAHVRQMITSFCADRNVLQYGGRGCSGRATVYGCSFRNNYVQLQVAEDGVIRRLIHLSMSVSNRITLPTR